ncbi:MAG: hypothetical protein Q9188_003993 [Gyalolechia gomerana]
MPGLKRKSTAASEPSNSSKSPKWRKRSPSLTKPSMSAEYIVDSSDDETVEASAMVNTSARKPAESSIAAKASPVLEPRPKVTGQKSHQPKKQKYQSPIRSSTASVSTALEENDASERSEVESITEADRPTPAIRNTTEEESESATDREASDEAGSETEENVEGREPIENPSIARSQEKPPPFKPPAGFEIASIRSSAKVRDLFSKENLRGKQVWHITAPASVPITSIKEVPIQKVAAGDSVLSYSDADYGLIQESGEDTEGKTLLVPFPEDNGYRLAGATIAQTLHLQEFVKLSALSDKAEGVMNGATRASKSHVKEVRQQPQGLRMRYRPFGDDSSSDDSDRAPRFKLPPIISPIKLSTEPRLIEDGVNTSPSKDGIKHKKKADTMRVDRDVQDTPRSSTKSSSKKRKPLDSDEPVANETQSGELRLGETADKEAQRRARKKQRKERRSSGSKNTWEADEARKILAASKKPNKSTTTTTIQLGDMAMESKRPEVVKAKRKKRKSEATEEA